MQQARDEANINSGRTPGGVVFIGSGEFISGAQLIITESNLSVATADKAPIKVEHRTDSSTDLSTLLDLRIGSKKLILLLLETLFLPVLSLKEKSRVSQYNLRRSGAVSSHRYLTGICPQEQHPIQ